MIFDHSVYSILKDLKAFKGITAIRQKHFDKADDSVPDKTFAVNLQSERLHPEKQDMVFQGYEDFYGQGIAVTVKSTDKKAAFFRAGQLIKLRADFSKECTSRDFFLISEPSGAKDGVYTFFVGNEDTLFVERFRQCKVGTVFTVSEPMGYVYYQPLRDRQIAAVIADGSGFGAAFAFKTALSQKGVDIPAFYWEKTCAEAGFLRIDMENKPDCPPDSTVFVFGKHSFCKSIREIYPKCMVRASYTESPARRADTEVPVFSCTVKKGDRMLCVKCPADQTLLRSLEQAGMCIRVRCNTGECGACRCRLLSGDVSFALEDHGRLAEAEKGYIYTCMSFPQSDISIEF